jgi:hypothetical protein
MKRFIAFLGVALLLVGLRLYDTGLVRLAEDNAEVTVFSATEFTDKLFLPTGADSYRVDLKGAENAGKLLAAANAEVQFTELDGKLIYAYSDRIPRTEWVHGRRVNLMIYTDGENVSAGVPILKGSY